MIAERIREEREELKQQFRAEGLAGVLAKQKGLLRAQIARKFGDDTAEKWSERVTMPDDEDRLQELGGMIIDCDTGKELLQKL